MDRVRPREITQENDLPLIAAWGGLASASYNITGDIVYADKLTNAYVDKAGQLRKRIGSLSNAGLSWFDNSINPAVHRFRFDGVYYLLIKTGTSLTLYASLDSKQYSFVTQKNNVFSDLAANSKATFATKVEGQVCHVLCATDVNQLISFTIVKRQYAGSVSGNTITGTLAIGIDGSVITSNNCILLHNNALFLPSSVSHSGSSLSFTGVNVNTIASGSLVRFHCYFWLRYCPASYYPGLYLANSSLRRNTLPLDVNVSIPTQLSDNPVIDEPQFNPSTPVMEVYASGALQTKVTNRQPATATEWDFSDGSYYTGAGLLTNPSPAFISFGGLVAGGQNTTVSLVRRRYLNVSGAPIGAGGIRIFDNKTPRGATFYDSNFNVIGAGVPSYFSLGSANINLNLASVIEIISIANYAGTSAQDAIADFDETRGSLAVGDGYCLPLYGYSFLITNRLFPNIVAVVGNRLVLTGSDSRVVYSNADWSFRGVTFNNCQISSINFTGSSAFSINLSQGSSEIRGVISANGVLIVGTDTGIFRVSSLQGATTPASADSASVSRVSNEILPNNNCLTLYDNRVFYISDNGLFQLQYSQETNELANQSLSSNVSDQFATVDALTYSEELRSFVVAFETEAKLLAFNLDSESWYTIKFATGSKPYVERGNDGFYFIVSQPFNSSMLSCTWDTNSSTDVSNLSGFFPQPLLGRAVTLTQSPTNVDSLVCPAELLKLLSSANIVLSPGKNHARCVGVSSVTITESSTILEPMPIHCYFVSKAFIGDKIDRAYRLRSVNLIVSGQPGSVSIAFVQPTNDLVDRAQTIDTYLIGTNEMGEPLLNNEYPQYQVRASAGNTTIIKASATGISEGWQVAIKFNGIGLAGMQLDTSRKSRKRLR